MAARIQRAWTQCVGKVKSLTMMPTSRPICASAIPTIHLMMSVLSSIRSVRVAISDDDKASTSASASASACCAGTPAALSLLANFSVSKVMVLTNISCLFCAASVAKTKRARPAAPAATRRRAEKRLHRAFRRGLSEGAGPPVFPTYAC
ncbi:MAG: hypothetical protein CO126_11745 [Hydrogenophilales bacterium CG_4_9_14_3_um_filter_63_34]|nr:MAG: hypothetical protein COZ24_11365 [Hydrogenophilales bacterium CG_4_10_14_3_um_filter_63_21]PJB02486.1 MAG: hypothetical protein CO126_11745 [Hydrogenophilales bacterium CG_4_9_14_3_um_filter_63_34]